MSPMSTCIIELNDIGVTAYPSEGEAVSSPGYAVTQGEDLITGEEARASARLHPLQSNNRFWQRLSMDPLRHPGGSVRHYADLAYAHLLQVHELAGAPDEVFFAVPGNFSSSQLSVLLGVTRHCPFRTVGLVDAAVAAAAGTGLTSDAVHIELQLHQAVLTQLSVSGEISRDAVQTVEGAGLLSLYDRWAHVVADAFIEQCRFDPLHSAAAEQYLYDLMPQFQAKSDELIDLEVRLGASVHRAGIERQSLLQAGIENWQQLFDRAKAMGTDGNRILLSHHWKTVPSVESFLPNSTVLPADAAARDCLEHAEFIRSPEESVRFVTRLPALESQAAQQPVRPAEEAPAAPAPTHVLIGSIAHPLAGPCYLQESNGDASCFRQAQAGSQCVLSLRDGRVDLTLLGERPVWLQGSALRVGDQVPVLATGDSFCLSSKGPKFQLIHVSISSPPGEHSGAEA